MMNQNLKLKNLKHLIKLLIMLIIIKKENCNNKFLTKA